MVRRKNCAELSVHLQFIKNFKAILYSSEKYFLLDNLLKYFQGCRLFKKGVIIWEELHC